MNEANSLQYKQTNEGAFKCWRSIASFYQYATPSKAPFPLMERHFPTNLIKKNTESLLLIFPKISSHTCIPSVNTIMTLSTYIILYLSKLFFSYNRAL